MPKRAALYLRVSTNEQTTENQRLELERVAQRSGWEIVGVYEDHGFSGKKGRDQRPEFNRMLEDATRRRFDVVAAWAVDRLGRSLHDLLGFINEMGKLGVDLYLHKQAIDTATPMGRMMFTLCGMFAEFEGSLIRERVIAGQQRPRASGKRIGRARHDAHIEAEVWRLRHTCMGKCKIARTLAIGTGAVQRILSTTAPPPKTAIVTLTLLVENNSKFVRGKKKAREYIELFHLSHYDVRKLASGDYELTIPYETDAHLDNTIDELVSEMAMTADDRHCFIETHICENGTERSW